jgi:hypothetical protein
MKIVHSSGMIPTQSLGVMMVWIVVEVTDDHIKLWDGKMKDEWSDPLHHEMEGDYRGLDLKPGDEVQLIVRKADK